MTAVSWARDARPPAPSSMALPVAAVHLFFVFAGGAFGPLLAQSAGHEPAVVELNASARAAGLGGAFQVGSDDSDAVFHHPALALGASGMMLGYQRYGPGAAGLSVSAATEWYGGGVAVGVQALDYASAGPGRRAGGLEPVLTGGDRGAADLVASVAYARSFGPLRVGATGKLLRQRIGVERETRGGLDVGGATELGPFQAALSVRNLGPDRVIGGVEVSLPTDVTLGVGGYGRPLGPLDVGLAAAVTRRGDGEWIGGGGVELGYWPVRGRTFVLRFGGRALPEGGVSPLTVGGSFWGDDLMLEWAWEGVDRRGGIHRVGVGWR